MREALWFTAAHIMGLHMGQVRDPDSVDDAHLAAVARLAVRAAKAVDAAIHEETERVASALAAGMPAEEVT